MRLTDSLEEQELLENVLERSKPNIPAECKGLHYLLATPFRYTPYPHGRLMHECPVALNLVYKTGTRI